MNSLQLWEHFLYMNVYMYVSILLKLAFFSPQRRLEAVKSAYKCDYIFEAPWGIFFFLLYIGMDWLLINLGMGSQIFKL